MQAKRWGLGFSVLGALLVAWPMLNWAVSLALADDTAASGPQLAGSGSAATEMREVEEFAEVSVSSAIKLDVTIGPAVSISMTADDNILPHVKTEVISDRLKIYVDESYSSKLGVKVQLTAPALRGLRASGAAKTRVTGASGERFRLGLSGASGCKWQGEVDALAFKADGGSRAIFSGTAGRLEMNCSGATKVDARDLQVKTAKAQLSGASTARVNVSDELNVEASGASSLRYSGQPTVKQRVSGASTVRAE
jgi:hypothetical protein